MILAKNDVGLAHTRKLYSRKGTLLGSVSYPRHWDEYLREQNYFRFAIRPKLSWNDAEPSAPLDIRTGEMTLYPGERGAVMIYGVTPEEFETLPGCSFSPSAAYIRSLLEK